MALCLRVRHIFYVAIIADFEIFKVLTLKHVFYKTKTSFEKLEYRFLVVSTTIESALFLNKIVKSQC